MKKVLVFIILYSTCFELISSPHGRHIVRRIFTAAIKKASKKRHEKKLKKRKKTQLKQTHKPNKINNQYVLDVTSESSEELPIKKVRRAKKHIRRKYARRKIDISKEIIRA